MSDCIFCKIGGKELPAKLIYEDADIFAFDDIHPQSPTHVLICPRKHMVSLDDASQEDAALLGKMLLVAKKLAAERKISGGYRTVINNGAGAGQSVDHLHLHVLGGRAMRWPPG
ncbi:MAG TPA: histidine triad nucleotide-binding protein [Candidatus Limnocylindrales bacterium]|nr:histidine triad nucleotide-binding protein [Candidatus Limnocylindrales bacterium]